MHVVGNWDRDDRAAAVSVPQISILIASSALPLCRWPPLVNRL